MSCTWSGDRRSTAKNSTTAAEQRPSEASPSTRNWPAFGCPIPRSGHSTCQMARHERSLRFAEGERELSRMVEAAGVETKVSDSFKLLMARDF